LVFPAVWSKQWRRFVVGDVAVGEVQAVEEGLVELAALLVVAALVEPVWMLEDRDKPVERLVGAGAGGVPFGGPGRGLVG
jgi:hypothetical protein